MGAGGVLLAVLTAVAAVSFAIAPAPMEATGRPSPLAQDWMGGATGEFVGDGGFFIVLFVIVLAIVALARRWRDSTGIERHQYRWLVLGAVVFTGTLVIGILTTTFPPNVRNAAVAAFWQNRPRKETGWSTTCSRRCGS